MKRVYQSSLIFATVVASAVALVSPAFCSEPVETTQAPLNLKGLVTEYSGSGPGELVEELARLANEKVVAASSIQKKDREYKGVARKALTQAKLAAQVVSEFRGFEVSSEAADVILDEKIRLKSSAAVEYAKQRKVDESHAKVSSALLQIAQGLGMEDDDRKNDTVESGMKLLRELVGSEEADKALASITSWAGQVNVPESIFKRRSWDMMELQQKSEDLVKTTLEGDPVMSYIRRSLHKYNSHSKMALAGAKIVNTTLSAAMLTPTIVSPAAQVTLLAYLAMTGGPEDSKLLKELYLDRRLESRWKRVNQEAGQVVNAYNNAVLTKNAVLLAFTESMMSGLGGETAAERLVGRDLMVARQSTRDTEISVPVLH